MIIEAGNKVHVVYRALYENSTRRHFLGKVVAADGALCRLEGYAFILDRKTDSYVRKPELRTTIIDLAESGYLVNVVDPGVDLESTTYRILQDVGLVVTDGKGFELNINEFGVKH